jgi:hypothetical protein
MLMHDAYPGGDRSRRRGEAHRFAVDQDPPLVRRQQTGEQVDNRRFAGAVFADQRKNFAGGDGHVDRPVGDDRAEPLRHAIERDERRRCDGYCHGSIRAGR